MALMTNQTLDTASATHMDRADIDVCICTFRRPYVAETIRSLAGQATGDLKMRVIVVDNDETPSARETVEQALAANGLDGIYIHAPARNISIARNACLDAVTAPWLVFIDDDETARPGWLNALLAHRAKTNADVVFGLVKALYEPGSPKWMVAADMHSTRAVMKNGVIETGYAGNALIRTALVGNRRFDLDLGRTGGEDTAFFSELYQHGAVLAYSDEGAADEPVPASRMSLKWLLRRSYRSGQTHAAMLIKAGGKRPLIALAAAAKTALCAGLAVVTVLSPGGWRKTAVRGALHAGVVAAALGRKQLELY
jgi:succinoglycan biosynthesis protein ExoM